MKEESILEEYLEGCCAKCACFRAKGLGCKNQPLGITHPETESCSRFEEKCCDNCCWLIEENVYGLGRCVAEHKYPYFYFCDDKLKCNCYVSRQQMRHYMAVILQGIRNAADPTNRRRPDDRELVKASSFAYKYMKVFSEL